jgi:hypothetical protein
MGIWRSSRLHPPARAFHDPDDTIRLGRFFR